MPRDLIIFFGIAMGFAYELNFPIKINVFQKIILSSMVWLYSVFLHVYPKTSPQIPAIFNIVDRYEIDL